MAHTVTTRTNTVAEALRDVLSRAERQVVNIAPDNVEEFLTTLDQIEGFFEQMADSDIDLRPEQARWESLLRRISSKPAPIAAAAARAGGFAALRAQHPPAESFWWHLDVDVRQRRLAALRRAAIVLVALVVIVGGGLWLVNKLFPPNPEAVFLMDAQSKIDRAVMEGDYATALDAATVARTQMPDSVELAVWEAVLTERAGDAELAATRLQAAQRLLPDRPEDFWVLVGNDRFQAADVDGAETAAQQALEANPDSAQAYFLLANVAEARGDRVAAMDFFDRTFTLAETDNPQLAVIAKVRLGQLLQSPANFAPPAATGTPAPAPGQEP